LIDKPIKEIDFVDVGAGTGIWTRMVHASGLRQCIAVEPNVDMRASGIADSRDLAINWVAGSAKATGLSASTVDWVSMASSFHWANFERSTSEFHRILRPGGYFTAL
jgi:ubiquinone/menaquinone biosynthesis C-methylase UbiE